jgi:signal transduction histidine kinase
MVVSHSLTRRLQESPTNGDDAVRLARYFANAQVATDLLLLTIILRYTGGVESPMAIFYVFHMAIGSLVLVSWQALLQGIWAVALYATLAMGELLGWIAPHYPFLNVAPDQAHFGHPQWVCMAVVVFACGLFGTLYFTLQIAARLDDREGKLRSALAALQQSQVAIQDIQARRSRFMQTAAHQLKSPMAAIQTMAGLIRDGYVEGDGVRKTTESIIRRCREGIVAVTELLTLARVQDADPRRHGDAVSDVGMVVKNVCKRRAPQAKEQGLQFAWEVVKGVDLRACVDRDDLTDCLDNLVGNAIKYTFAPGSVEVTVERRRWEEVQADAGQQMPARDRAAEAEAYVLVTVKDTGMGMKEEELMDSNATADWGTVFDAFRRGNGALAAGISGSGLGLSIVRVVVEQANGRVRVRSTPGKGTTFTVMFPAESSLPAGPRIRDTRAGDMLAHTSLAGQTDPAGLETQPDRPI